MTTHSRAWRFTGLHWESGSPVLTASPLPAEPGSPPQAETRRAGAPGERISWELAAPRACTGIWSAGLRRPCPARTDVAPDGTDSQCAACARADRGRQIARDAVTSDDGREYLLYLAWFGPGLVKVGLTAAERGRDRLLEQGAVTFAVLAAGPYGPVREAELLVAATGLAAERVTARAKAAAWLVLPPPSERAGQLAAVRDQVGSLVAWPDEVALRQGGIVDQARDFALTCPVTGPWLELTGTSPGAILSGQIQAVIGRRLLLDTPAGRLLCDMRRVAGWAIRTVPAATALPQPSGLALAAGPAPGGRDANVQQALF